VSGYWVGLMIRLGDDRNPPPPLVETRYRCCDAVLEFDVADELVSFNMRQNAQTEGISDSHAISEMLDE
jgi:hypothetical protein